MRLLLFILAAFLALPSPPSIWAAAGDENWDNRFGHSDFFNTHLAVAVTTNGHLYVGGSLQIFSRWDGRVWNRFNAANNNGLAGDIWAMQADGTNVYVGGSFQNANAGQVLNRIALIRSAGVYSPLGSGLNGTVYALVVRSNEVYAGGSFTTAGGASAANIARWNGTSWSALGAGVGATVRSLAFGPDGSLYAGGTFTTAGGSTIRGLARWNGSTWTAVGTGVNGDALALFRSGNDMYVGGNFTTAGGLTVNRLARWNGTAWSALGTGANNEVRSLYEWNGQIYAGGNFTIIGGTSATGIARWTGASWTAVDRGVTGDNQDVRAMTTFRTNLVIAGAFLSAGDRLVNRIALWNGTNWSALHQAVSQDVNALARHGTNIFTGGDFQFAGGKQVNRVARWDGQEWLQLGPGTNSGFNATVRALALAPDGTLFAGGSFTLAGTNPVNRIARFDGTGWQPLGNGLSNGVNAIAVHGTNVYAAGSFAGGSGVLARGVARWNGTSWSDVGGSFDPFSYIYALAVIGNDLYAGGLFTSVGGVAATNIARWDGTRWWPVGSGITFPNSFPIVNALAVNGTDLYAGGLFSRAGTNTVSNVAKWNGQFWSAVGAGVDREVKALGYIGDTLYAGGLLTMAGAGAANYIAAFENGAWSPLGSGTWEENRYVHAVIGEGTNVYVGGRFRNAGTNSSPYFAIWHPRRVAPTIALTAPGADEQFAFGSNIPVRATATAATGSIARVDFYRNTQLAGSVTNPPYEMTWSNLLSGDYLVAAEAVDNAGVKATTPAVPIRVVPPPGNQLPVVAMASPQHNAIFSVGEIIPLVADASDGDGSVLQVAFYEGDNLLGIATSAPFSINWSNALRRIYSVRAVAMDNYGVRAQSAAISIRVQQPPTVSIASPDQGNVFYGPRDLTLRASAQDVDGSVTNVIFYINGELLGRYHYWSSPSYYFTWTNVPFGTYSVTARAFDDLGGVKLSAPVTFSMEPTNALPTVSIATPVAGEVFVPPTNILITVNASDSDGFIREVRFHLTSGQLGVVTNAPFEFLWQNLRPGPACLYVVAVDDRGGTRTSAQVCIQVATNLSPAPRYALIDLGELTGLEGRAQGINAAGQVVGGARTPTLSSTYPFFYSHGTMQFLFSGVDTGSGYAINDAGDIAGVVANEAFLYTNGVLRKLGSLGGPSGTSGARALNNLRQVVGFTSTGGAGAGHAFLYESNQMLDLGTLVAGETDAASVNDAGLVVGWSGLAGFIFDRTNGMRALALPGGGTTKARGINHHGTITGQRTSPDNYQRAFLLQGTNVENLGTLGGYNSVALALNNSNQVVGYADNFNLNPRAFLWQDHVMYDLHQLLHTNLDWVLHEATALNDRGQIVGWGRKGLSSYARAFLLTPLPRAGASNQSPAISITAPNNNAGFFATEDVVIEAAGFDPDGEVARVEFYEGNNLLGAVTNRPYRLTWPAVPAGDFILTARATDLLGASQTSVPVNISVVSLDSNAPAVAIFGASSAAWNDDVRTKIRNTRNFRRVDLFAAGSGAPVPTLAQLQQYDAVFVYSSDAFGSSVGFGNVLADYVDAGGGVVLAAFSYSSFTGIEGRFAATEYLPWARSGSQSGTPLTLVPALPRFHPILDGVNSFHGGPESYHHQCNGVASGATLVASWSNGQPLAATREKNGGRIVGLNFFPPSSEQADGFWNAGTDGARLMANALTWSAQRPVVVSVSIKKPVPPASFYPGQPIVLEAQASSSAGTITRVEYYAGTNLLGTAFTTPFPITWTNAPLGNHSLTAVAFDITAHYTVSPVIRITVESRMTVTLTSPSSGTRYTPTNITFAAQVTNPDASVLKVEYFAGPDKVGEASVPPYPAVWQNVGVGTYALTARASDSIGTMKTSAPVSVTVINPNNPVDNYWIGPTANWFTTNDWSSRVPLPQDTATVNNGGTPQIAGGLARVREVRLGVTGNGNLSLSGGVLDVRTQVLLGSDTGSEGNLTISGGGEFFTGELGVGLAGLGQVVQVGGRNFSTNLWIGSELTAQGSYVLAGGELFSFSQSLGRRSDALFLHTGGTNTVSSSMRLGTGNGDGLGKYDLRGGRLSVPIQLVGYEGPALFQQSGGENLVSDELVIGDFNDGEYAITNGLLATRDLVVGQSRGTLNIQSALAQIIVSNRLVFDRFSIFQGVPGSAISLWGDSFDVRHNLPEHLSGISNLTLVVAGTNLTRLEVAGVTARGFASNIVLGALTLGSSNASRSQLVDQRDNDRSGVFGDETFFSHFLNWSPGSSLDLNGLPMTIFNPVAVRGELLLAGGRLSAPSVTVMTNGLLRTGGTIEGQLVNHGQIKSGPASRKIQVNGTFDQPFATANFAVDIAGVSETEFDQITASGEAHLGGKLTVRLTDGFVPARTIFPVVMASQVIGTFAVTDLPPATNGLTWHVRYETNAVYVESTLGPQLAMVAPITFNSQSGLYEQHVLIENSGLLTVAAVRVLIHDLSPDVAVFNASGETNDVPYVRHNLPLAPGDSVLLVIEYAAPVGAMFTPRLELVTVLPEAQPNPVGTILNLDSVERLPDGNYLLGWPTRTNETYYIQYSTDLSHWKTARPAIVGTGRVMQWLDSGPPKTESAPALQSGRFYRALLITE